MLIRPYFPSLFFSLGVVYALPRDAGATNQRIQFDIEPCGRHLATGGQVIDARGADLECEKNLDINTCASSR